MAGRCAFADASNAHVAALTGGMPLPPACSPARRSPTPCPAAQGRDALPSLRYLTLIREGAADYGLTPEYREWLEGLQHYAAQRPGQKVRVHSGAVPWGAGWRRWMRSCRPAGPSARAAKREPVSFSPRCLFISHSNTCVPHTLRFSGAAGGPPHFFSNRLHRHLPIVGG